MFAIFFFSYDAGQIMEVKVFGLESAQHVWDKLSNFFDMRSERP